MFFLDKLFKIEKETADHTVKLQMKKEDLYDIRNTMHEALNNRVLLGMIPWENIALEEAKVKDVVHEIVEIVSQKIEGSTYHNDMQEDLECQFSKQQIYLIYSIYAMKNDIKKILCMESAYAAMAETFEKFIKEMDECSEEERENRPV
jgi:hypothetical protein